MRSAEAFGASGVVALQGSVQFTNGKFLRAAAGSAFRLPFMTQVSTGEMALQLRTSGFALYGLAAEAECYPVRRGSSAGVRIGCRERRSGPVCWNHGCDRAHDDSNCSGWSL